MDPIQMGYITTYVNKTKYDKEELFFNPANVGIKPLFNLSAEQFFVGRANFQFSGRSGQCLIHLVSR